MVKTRDDFMPDVGAFLDNVDGDITDAVFEVATGDYADRIMVENATAKPSVGVRLTIESPELEKPASQFYSIGSQELWEILDDGKAVRNIKNPDRHVFRKGSIAWTLAEAMFLAAGNGDLGKGQDIIGINRNKYMTDADFYTGTSWHWVTKTVTTTIQGRTVTSNPRVPEKFLGEAKPVSKGKTATKTVDTVEDAELDALIVANATDKTDRELKSFAVRNPDIKKNDAYMKAIVSGKKLKQLEEAGLLTMDPDSKKYI